MSPIKMEKVETASRLALEFIYSLNAKDCLQSTGLLSDGCSIETESDLNPVSGNSDQISKQKFLEDEFKMINTEKMEIEEILGLGKNCAVFWHIKNADQKSIASRGVYLMVERNGKIESIKKYLKANSIQDEEKKK